MECLNASLSLGPNRNRPLVMHIDLNSCFATVEQQANPLLRGKPLGIAAYNSPGGCIIAASIEAKALGVKVGMNVREGRLLCPGLLIKEPDPPKYREVHRIMRQVFLRYTPDVTPKSIDEAILDFEHPPLPKQELTELGAQIKHDIKQEIGEWMRCSVGIGPNRFLAKTAASLKKPDGLETISSSNLQETMNKLTLTDLCGINTRMEARLNSVGIFSASQFLEAPLETLQRAFQSVIARYWYLRLRGYEIDAIDFNRKSFGQSYALPKATFDKAELGKILMKLTEKMARRLRRAGMAASGVQVICLYRDGTFWHQSKRFSTLLLATPELFKKACYLLNRQPEVKPISKLAVACFDLTNHHKEQLTLFETDQSLLWRSAEAADQVNDKYGEFSLIPALMLGTEGQAIDRIAFGGVLEL